MNLPPYLMPLLMQAMGPQAQTVQNMQAMPQMMGAFADGGHVGGVQPDSFVIPADVVSALGEGSTDAGAEMLQMRFGGRLIDGDGTGRSDDVPASGPGMVMRFSRGEYLLPPEAVEAAGGHDALSRLVQSIRDRYTRTLENIPAPQR